MHDAFAQQIDGWHDFYLLVGTASATLVGLLFLALTLNVEILRRDELGILRTLAARSFICFINLLIISGVLLIPQQSPRGVGIPLICIGGITIVRILQSIARSRRAGQHENIGESLRHTGLILFGMAALVALGISIWAGWTGALDWMTGAVLTLLAAASQSAWDLLTLTRTA
jgi:hypothetical protein